MNGRVRVPPFEFDLRTFELRKGGRLVKLHPQPARVLALLVRSPGEVVRREDIRKEIWGEDTFVDFELGINSCIKQIRTAMGDDADQPRYVQTVPREGYRFIAPLASVERTTAEASRSWEASPYPGLSSFSQKDAEHFFGREEEVQALWTKVQERCLLGLIGPSGAGKSSLLRAGVIPSAPEGWGVVLCQPRNDPFQTLAAAIGGDPEEFLKAGRGRSAQALWIVDQFEELFTLNDEETQKKFALLLARAAALEVHVLLSMRDDFLIHCQAYPGLAPVFKDLTPVVALEGAALRRALVEPARMAGYQFEDEALVADILTEVSRERGALPLLAFAASRLWERRDRKERRLTREAYLSIGGVAGALAKHAEETLSRIGVEHEPIVREIFRNLTSAQGTRVPSDKEELLTVFPDREKATHVVAELVDARLLTSAGREVEIIHESLLAAWPRLVRWQAQGAEGALLRDQLRQAARAWEERRRPDDLLWTGTSLLEYRAWRARYIGGLSTIEEAFANAAIRLAGQRRRRRQVALGALVTAALAFGVITTSLWRQSKAEALRAEASKLLALAELRLQEDPTEALAFATASLELADTQETRVFVMKVLWEAPPAFELVANSQAVKAPAFSPDGRWLATAGHTTDSLVWSEDGRGPIVLPGHETSPRGSNRANWASKDLLVTGSAAMVGSQVHLWSLPEGRRLRTIDFGQPSYWQVGPQRLLAETLESGTAENRGLGLLRSWALPDGVPVVLGRIDGKELGASWTWFAPDGRSWFYAKDLNLYSLPLPAGAGRDRLFARLRAEVAQYRIDSDQMAVADKSGETHVWTFPPEGPVRESVIPRPDTASFGMLPDSSGRWLKGDPNMDQQLRIWDLASWKVARPMSLRRSTSWYGAMSRFHPTEDWVVASTATFTRVTFWSLGKAYPSVVDGYRNTQRPVAFSPDGMWLATSWTEADGRLRLWPLPGSGVSEIRSLHLPEGALVTSVAFDPKGRFLFAVGNQDRAWVIPLDGSPPRKLQSFSEDTLLRAAAVSPSGRRVATAFFYGQGEETLRVWDLEAGELKRFDLPKSQGTRSEGTTGYERGIFGLAFADESTLYSAGDGGLRRWNLETGTHEVLAAASPGYGMHGSFSGDSRVAITAERRLGQVEDCLQALLHNLASGTSRQIAEFGQCGAWRRGAGALDPSGTVAATGSLNGIVRVGRLSGGEPHLLVGHRGAVDYISISPDLRWVATTGEDNTLRLWPMPDLSKPPLHTLPHDELLAKLRSLTNLRVVRDLPSNAGWKVEIGPFPGWKDTPNW